jgi:hypothetical protein
MTTRFELGFSRLFPHHVDEGQSRTRGLKVGWYAIDNEGDIASGPYQTRDECVARIERTSDAAIVPFLWRRPTLSIGRERSI